MYDFFSVIVGLLIHSFRPKIVVNINSTTKQLVMSNFYSKSKVIFLLLLFAIYFCFFPHYSFSFAF